MQVVLTSHGSTGDIYPLMALALALRGAGHHVRFATSPPFRNEIEAAGIDYIELPPRWTQAELSYWMGRLQHLKAPLFQLRELYRAALPHIEELIDAMDAALIDADLLVSSYLFPMNRAIADRRGVPFATFAFAHNTVPSRYYPPEGVPRLRYFPTRVQHTWNRWCWRLGNLAVDTVINQTIRRQLKARGLPMVRDFFSKPAKLVLVGVSPGLMKPPFQLNPRFRFTGYCRWQPPRSESLEHEIDTFAAGMRIPVLTFGSMVYDDPQAWMRRLAVAWPRDRRMIVQRGWAGFEALPDCPHIRVVGPMSHDQLLQHASVVIHHGGAGTTASVLHAGRPHIIVPHIADQHFFSHEVKRLGCGIRLARHRWPERLAAAVAYIEENESFETNSCRAKKVLHSENGALNAVDELERFVLTKVIAEATT